jgi:hypothetical protein
MFDSNNPGSNRDYRNSCIHLSLFRRIKMMSMLLIAGIVLVISGAIGLILQIQNIRERDNQLPAN